MRVNTVSKLYCVNAICYNRAVCRTTHPDYTCIYLAGYYGQHCEYTTTKFRIYRILGKSVSYIAIIVMTFVAAFVIITDILKYGFGIDPTCEESRRLQQEKRAKRRRPVVQRFVYVNASKTVSQPEQGSNV